MLYAEMLKIRRSHMWVVTIVLPLLAVVTGSLNYQANQGVLSHGWDSLFGQVLLFYSLFYFSIGVTIIVAASWRMEHQGSNFTMLRTSTRRTVSLIAAKTASTLVLVGVMQVVLIVGTVGVGMVLVGSGAGMIGKYLFIAVLGVIVAIPLVLLQSVLSMYLTSFAAPVAWSFLGIVIGTGLSLAPGVLGNLALVFPHSLVTRTLSIASITMGNDAAIKVGDIAQILVATIVLAAALMLVFVRIFNNRERS